MLANAQVKRKINRGRETFRFFLAAIPVIGFVIFGLVPMVVSLMLSFTNVKGSILDDFTFVGFANFAYLVKNVNFLKSMRNTLFYVLNVPLSLAVGLFIAYLVNKTSFSGRCSLSRMYVRPFRFR